MAVHKPLLASTSTTPAPWCSTSSNCNSSQHDQQVHQDMCSEALPVAGLHVPALCRLNPVSLNPFLMCSAPSPLNHLEWVKCQHRTLPQHFLRSLSVAAGGPT